MIKVTRVNRQDKFWVNENMIEFMEETPDTILTMLSGRKFPVAETAEQIIRLIANVRKPIVIPRGEFYGAIEE